MRQRTLGSQGLTVSEQGLGCMGMTYGYGHGDDDESVATLHAALEAGVTFLDSADMYGPWTNEELLGRVLRGRRDQAVIASKFGQEITPEGHVTGRVNGRPAYVRAALDATLGRLGVDHLDLYYLHRVDPDVDVADTWAAMAEAVQAGKVRHLGICEAAASTIRRAHAVHPVTAVQTEYSLVTRDVEHNGVLEAVRELGIGFVAYSPLGRGLVSGTIRTPADLPAGDRRRAMPRFQDDNLSANLAVVDRVGALARDKGRTPAQLALAWVLAQGVDVVPIPGTKRRSYLRQNVAASDIVLSDADLAAIDAAVPAHAAAGDRYEPGGMAKVDL